LRDGGNIILGQNASDALNANCFERNPGFPSRPGVAAWRKLD
jgi:hypothetical protein